MAGLLSLASVTPSPYTWTVSAGLVCVVGLIVGRKGLPTTGLPLWVTSTVYGPSSVGVYATSHFVGVIFSVVILGLLGPFTSIPSSPGPESVVSMMNLLGFFASPEVTPSP